MVKEIKMAYRVTLEQKKVLEARAKAEGYSKVAFYVRAILFRSIVMEEKIDAIYKQICRDK
jgi:uncharacterized protein (DUF1778 family)